MVELIGQLKLDALTSNVFDLLKRCRALEDSIAAQKDQARNNKTKTMLYENKLCLVALPPHLPYYGTTSQFKIAFDRWFVPGLSVIMVYGI